MPQSFTISHTGKPTRTLHVAALPFPTHQGTQAAVRSMMEALGSNAKLLTYADGHEDDPVSFPIERGPKVFGRSALRSGPSIRKVVENVALMPLLRRQWRTSFFGAVFAHHVEAAALTLALGIQPLVFVAHTRLEPELPLYFKPLPDRLVSKLGRWTDKALCLLSDAVAAISPALRDHLALATGHPVTYLPIPWKLAEPITDLERHEARERFGLHGRDVLLFVGNLDAYQGWEDIVAALVQVRKKRPDTVLLVATASDPAPLRKTSLAAGVGEHVRFELLEGESCRRLVHAAADVAVVTRRVPGGLPVKLLDALSRGLPTITTFRAIADLPLGGATLTVADDDPNALAHAARVLLADAALCHHLATRGRKYIEAEHSESQFMAAMQEIIATLRVGAPGPH